MQFKSIAIVAVTATKASAAGCYPSWTSGGAYSSGSLVSATRTYTTTNSDGDTVTTSVKKNFKCTVGSQPSLSLCPQIDPSNTAFDYWSDEGECSGTAPAPATSAPTTPPTFSRWEGTGCPDAWTSGKEYEGGDLAEVDGVVYKCSSAQFVSAWCGQENYKPGESQYWSSAWTRLGSCDGTIALTASPDWVVLDDAGGCPDDFIALYLL